MSFNLSIHLSISLSISLSLYFSTSLPLPIYLSIYLFIYPGWLNYLFIYLSVSIYLSIQVSGTYTANLKFDFIDYEVKKAFEWLSASGTETYICKLYVFKGKTCKKSKGKKSEIFQILQSETKGPFVFLFFFLPFYILQIFSSSSFQPKTEKKEDKGDVPSKCIVCTEPSWQNQFIG